LIHLWYVIVPQAVRLTSIRCIRSWTTERQLWKPIMNLQYAGENTYKNNQKHPCPYVRSKNHWCPWNESPLLLGMVYLKRCNVQS
jgi:hypothetical protein